MRPQTRADIAWYLSQRLVRRSKAGSGVLTSSGARNESQCPRIAFHASSTLAGVAYSRARRSAVRRSSATPRVKVTSRSSPGRSEIGTWSEAIASCHLPDVFESRGIAMAAGSPGEPCRPRKRSLSLSNDAGRTLEAWNATCGHSTFQG